MKEHWRIGLYIALFAAMLVLAFYVGRNSVSTDVSDLQREIEQYRAKELEAAVVKRVSQQMEDIAYQQRDISERERDRAQEQSELAILERERAEKESQLARIAENQAMVALGEAEIQRANAEKQEGIAKEQLVQTRLQKSISDTLSYRNLGRSLGSASVALSELGHKVEASRLAYASWYFVDRYKGNVYQPTTFKALSLTSESIYDFNMSKGGTVSGIMRLDGSSAGCVAISKFGEIERWDIIDGKATSKVLYHNSLYDFRDLENMGDGSIWVLSFRGPICLFTPNGKLTPYQIPDAAYFNIVKTSDDVFMLMARNSVTWFDIKKKQVLSTVQLPSTVTATAMCNGFMELCFDNGKYAMLSFNGKLTEKKSPADGVVTAALYDSKRKNHYYGLKDGTILVTSSDGKSVALSGHRAQITDIKIDDDLLVTSSYDKSVLVWSLGQLKVKEAIDFGGDDIKTSIAGEWLVPAEVKFSGWPMCVSLDRDKDVMWIGTNDGKVRGMPYSVRKYVAVLRNKYGSSLNLSKDEWLKNVGVNVPYVKFIDRK